MRSLILWLLALGIAVPRARAQDRSDTTAVLRIIDGVYRGSEIPIRAVSDTGSDPASRAALAALLKVPRRTPGDATLPTCTWVATSETGLRGVEATLEQFVLDGRTGQAIVSVVCGQPRAAIGDIYFMRRQFKLRKVRGRWRVLPSGRVEVTETGGSARRDRLTIAEADKASSPSARYARIIGQALQLSSTR